MFFKLLRLPDTFGALSRANNVASVKLQIPKTLYQIKACWTSFLDKKKQTNKKKLFEKMHRRFFFKDFLIWTSESAFES